ncbi:hypothetical protein D049_1148, partial [Vibrio parahaemolyticus VPTS-2010]
LKGSNAVCFSDSKRLSIKLSCGSSDSFVVDSTDAVLVTVSNSHCLRMLSIVSSPLLFFIVSSKHKSYALAVSPIATGATNKLSIDIPVAFEAI